jgi:hypothetical protein
MLLIAVALASGSIVGLALGGRVRRIAEARFRSVGLLLAGAGCEFAGSHLGAGWFGGVLLIAGYGLLVGFAVRNAALTGMVLVAVGLAANLTVIALDGGMPVRGVAPGASYGARHHGERPGDHLTGLADVIRVSPLGETVSAGDIVLSLGVATVVVRLMRPARRRPRRPLDLPLVR